MLHRFKHVEAAEGLGVKTPGGVPLEGGQDVIALSKLKRNGRPGLWVGHIAKSAPGSLARRSALVRHDLQNKRMTRELKAY